MESIERNDSNIAKYRSSNFIVSRFNAEKLDVIFGRKQ
jgi:hypothetical protein